MSDNNKVIAFCGTRGLPANYGGFETAVDEITDRFVARGFACDVFCRTSASGEQAPRHQGRELVYVKGSRFRTFDTFLSSIRTGLHLWKNKNRYSHVFWFNNANFPGIILTRLAGLPTSVNTDGLEWRRAKWSWPFKLYYLVASLVITRCCPTLISDSCAIQEFYQKKFRKHTHMVPYGAPVLQNIPPKRAAQVLERFGLESGRYFLQVTRFEPDNLPLQTAREFRRSGLSRHDYKMVLVGFKDATRYARKVKALDGIDGVVVLDAIYDPTVLQVLRSNSFCYVHGNSVGGTNPALLEAMACCPRVLAIDHDFSREVLGSDGLYFDPLNIAPMFRVAVDLADQGPKLADRVSNLYQWDGVATAYMRLAAGEDAAYAPFAAASVQRRETVKA